MQNQLRPDALANSVKLNTRLVVTLRTRSSTDSQSVSGDLVVPQDHERLIGTDFIIRTQKKDLEATAKILQRRARKRGERFRPVLFFYRILLLPSLDYGSPGAITVSTRKWERSRCPRRRSLRICRPVSVCPRLNLSLILIVARSMVGCSQCSTEGLLALTC